MADDNDRERLNRLSSQIAEIRAEEALEEAKKAENAKGAENMSVGTRAGVELVTCVLAGVLIGWLLDRQFETQPAFLIIFLLTGICMGFYEVYRITNQLGQSVGYAGTRKNTPKTPTGDSPDEEA